MTHKHSNMEVAVACDYCGKWLKETEEHFFGNECSECHDRHMEERHGIKSK